MQKKRWVIYLFSFILLLNLVGAQGQQDLGKFKLNECVDLIQTCTNCTFVNLTSIIPPRSNSIIVGDFMQQQGISYNHTFCNTSLIGDYIYWAYGDPNGIESNPAGVSFTVTKTGMEFQQSFTVPLMMPLIMILLTAGFSLFLAFKINFKGLKTILIGFSGVLLLFGIMYTLNINNDILSGFESITQGYVLFYRIIIMLTWVVFFAIFVYIIFMAIESIKRIKGLK